MIVSPTSARMIGPSRPSQGACSFGVEKDVSLHDIDRIGSGKFFRRFVIRVLDRLNGRVHAFVRLASRSSAAEAAKLPDLLEALPLRAGGQEARLQGSDGIRREAGRIREAGRVSEAGQIQDRTIVPSTVFSSKG